MCHVNEIVTVVETRVPLVMFWFNDVLNVCMIVNQESEHVIVNYIGIKPQCNWECMNICNRYAKCWCWNEWIEKTLLDELVLMLRCLMINDEWSLIRGVLCPPQARSMSRGKPSISLKLGRKEVMKPETIPIALSIFKSATTWVALMISELVVT